MNQPGYVAPVRKPGDQDEFNPTLMIFDTSPRDNFCNQVVSIVILLFSLCLPDLIEIGLEIDRGCCTVTWHSSTVCHD